MWEIQYTSADGFRVFCYHSSKSIAEMQGQHNIKNCRTVAYSVRKVVKKPAIHTVYL